MLSDRRGNIEGVKFGLEVLSYYLRLFIQWIVLIHFIVIPSVTICMLQYHNKLIIGVWSSQWQASLWYSALTFMSYICDSIWYDFHCTCVRPSTSLVDDQTICVMINQMAIKKPLILSIQLDTHGGWDLFRSAWGPLLTWTNFNPSTDRSWHPL